MLLPFEFTSDFEQQMREGWESFPFAQDIGYDPTLQPEVIDGRRALARLVQPTKKGELALGFIRKLDLVLAPDSRLSFEYLVSSCGRVRGVEIGAYANKKRYAQVEAGSAGSWQRLDVALARLGLESGARLSALYVATRLEQVGPGCVQRFYIDRVRVNGQREPDFTFDKPKVIVEPNRRVALAQKTYRAGDQLRLKLRAPFRVESVRMRLFAPNNKMVADRSATELSLLLHQFAASDPPGIWRMEVEGGGARTRLLLLYSPVRPHPRLLFDKTKREWDRQVWEKLAARRDELRKTVQAERAAAIEKLNPEELLPGIIDYFGLLQPPAELALLEALGYFAFNETAAAERARDLLIRMSKLPRWVHPWFTAHGYRTYYPVGIAAAQLALSYDLVFDQLTEEERRQIEQGLMGKAILPAFEEYFLNDRIALNTSNWISHAVGGTLVAALALDAQPAAPQILGLYLKFSEHLNASYTEDGAYGEGFGYHKFDMDTASWVAAAANRLLGIDFRPKLERSYLYPLYASFGDGQLLDFGDSSVEIGSTSSFAYLAATSQDPHLKRFYLFSGLRQQGWQASSDPTLQRLYQSARGNTVGELIWDVAPPEDSPLELPPSSVFPEKGNVVFRSGWDQGATVINLRAGAGFNHTHFDQGSLLIASRGRLLLGEAGPTHYYNDPFYLPYFIQAIGHNTVLIDDDPESQAPASMREFGEHPEITHSFLGRQIDYARAELQAVYRGDLKHYQRTLVYSRDESLVVVFDQLVSDEPHFYTALLHPPSRESVTSLGDASFRISRGDARLLIKSFMPEGITGKVAPAPLPLAAYQQARSQTIESRARVEIRTPKASRTAFFLTLLGPTDSASEVQVSKKFAASRLINNETAAGIQTGDGVFLFPLGGKRPLRWQAYETDGQFLETAGSRITVVNARTLKRESEALLSCDVPLSFELEFQKEQVRMWAHGFEPTTIRLKLAARPKRLTQDGVEMPVVYQAGVLTFGLEPGRHELMIVR